MPKSAPYLSLLVMALCLAESLNLQAATYYVDSSAGDDQSAGTDISTPWKTLSKVSQASFAPGDKVLFAHGGVWTGQLTIHDAGADGNPIYFGAYGNAALPKPTINGAGEVKAAIFVKDKADHVTVEGFALTNFDGKDIFDGAEGDRCGIKAGEWGGELSDIKILNNEIFFVEGFSNHPIIGSPRGTKLDPKTHSQYSCGALFANASDMTGVTIDGNEVHDCTGSGIFVFAFKRSSGVLIQNNKVNNIGSDGIELLNSEGPVVQYNSCIKAGQNSGAKERGPGDLGYHGLAVCGMWAIGSSNMLFQYNYCEGTRQIKYDGEAWDFDMNLGGTCIYQYNFSRDNEGGFILSNQEKHPGLKRICRFNISVNDGGKQGAGEGFFNGTADYYNNIFYRNDAKNFLIDAKKLSGVMSGTFENNIFYTNATGGVYQTADRIFSHNCFYGHTPVGPGSDAVLDDPLFVDIDSALAVHGLKGLEGFKLKLGSPCSGAGVAIPDNGGKNFWGEPLGGAANIGAD